MRKTGIKTSKHQGVECMRDARAFTLTELLIAIAILVIIMLVVSKVFSTASQVSGMGEASNDVLQEQVALDRHLTQDLERLSYDGIMVIRCVSVINSIHGPGGPLLNPDLPPTARIRADQLLFFKTGYDTTINYHTGSGGDARVQTAESRVYYGHGFQLPLGEAVRLTSTFNQAYAMDVRPTVTDMTPWRQGNVQVAETLFEPAGNSGTVYSSSVSGEKPAAQPESRQWVLVRQGVLLGDDDGNDPTDDSKSVYLVQGPVAKSIFFNWQPVGSSPQLRDGRANMAATVLGDIRRQILLNYPSLTPRTWNQQRDFIRNQMLYYPRAERVAPSPHRVDHALTNNIISSGCSSFIVDWTYDPFVGTLDSNGDGVFEWGGMSENPLFLAPNATTGGVNRAQTQPWFGLDDGEITDNPRDVRGVRSLLDWMAEQELANEPWQTIFPDNIEYGTTTPGQGIVVREYMFGFNHDSPLLHPITGKPNRQYGAPEEDAGYTPWPTALRITATLHDPSTDMTTGRTVQYVIRLPGGGS